MTTLTDFAKAKHLVNSHHGYSLEAAIADAVAAERERCARIAESYWREVQDTREAHYRYTDKPFRPEDFSYRTDLAIWSMQTAQKIRDVNGQTTGNASPV